MAHWSRKWLIAALLAPSGAVGFAGTPVHAVAVGANTPDITVSSLGDYARELNDERLDVREAATKKLIDDVSIKTDDIMEYVRSQWDTLAPEAAERFLIASRERYIANPGAIGIEFGKSQIATVDRVVTGTPADKVLRRGDQIVSLNGQVLPESSTEQREELLKQMAGLKAGDIVQAHIRRDQKELDVEFALADPKQLPRFEDFIVSMQSQMLQQWIATCEERLPRPQQMLIDMDVAGAPSVDSNQGSASAESANAGLINELSHRRAEVSQSIARVMEQSSASDSPERRLELERDYLPLINEFARLNARLRLLENMTAVRRRR